MSALLAFLHHVAAFALVAALVVEFVLIRDELTAATVRRLVRADMVLGISAGVLLVAVLSVYPTLAAALMARGIGQFG